MSTQEPVKVSQEREKIEVPSNVKLSSVKIAHFHVLAGFHGCMPETNEFYSNLDDAREGLRQIVKDLRESRNTLKETIKSGYYELSKKTTALCDYIEITDCLESDCI